MVSSEKVCFLSELFSYEICELSWNTS